jgi:hypothetical protein
MAEELDGQGIIHEKRVDQPELQDEWLPAMIEPTDQVVVLSIPARKEIITQKVQLFEERLGLLEEAINTSDEKMQARIRLMEQIERHSFTIHLNKMLVSILHDEDPQKHTNTIATLQRDAKNASTEYKRCVAQWNYWAVKENAYQPIGDEAIDKVNKLRLVEQQKWANFDIKADKNNGSSRFHGVATTCSIR